MRPHLAAGLPQWYGALLPGLQDRVLDNPKVTVHLNTTPIDVFADHKGRMAGMKVKDSVTGEERTIDLRGLFYGIGHNPNRYI